MLCCACKASFFLNLDFRSIFAWHADTMTSLAFLIILMDGFVFLEELAVMNGSIKYNGVQKENWGFLITCTQLLCGNIPLQLSEGGNGCHSRWLSLDQSHKGHAKVVFFSKRNFTHLNHHKPPPKTGIKCMFPTFHNTLRMKHLRFFQLLQFVGAWTFKFSNINSPNKQTHIQHNNICQSDFVYFQDSVISSAMPSTSSAWRNSNKPLASLYNFTQWTKAVARCCWNIAVVDNQYKFAR